MTAFKLGDEVCVLRSRGPGGGNAATVTKVGRRYATAEWETATADWRGEPCRHAHSIEFDMETGHEKGTNSSHGRYVKTRGQVERDARERAAITSLLARKIRFDYGHGFTLEQLEALAELVETFGAEV